jgi:hypothetical protein
MYGAAGFLQKMNDSFFKSVAENYMVHFFFYYITIIQKLPNNRVIYSLPNLNDTKRLHKNSRIGK